MADIKNHRWWRFTFILTILVLVYLTQWKTASQKPMSPTARAAACDLHSTGDATCDGTVDITDFEVFRKEYLGEIATTDADFDGDTTITIADFEIWRRGYFTNTNVTSAPSVTQTITAPPSPTGAVGAGNGIWISREEMKALPISGQTGCESGSLCSEGWNAIITSANSTGGAPDIDTYDLPHPKMVLASAIASVRLGYEPGKTAESQKYYAKAVQGLMDVMGTEKDSTPNPDGSGGKVDGSLAIARNLPMYVIASDIIGLYPDGSADSAGTKWGNHLKYMYHQKFTFRIGDGGESLDRNLPGCASNGCAMAGGAHIALALYFKEKTVVDKSWLQFRRYSGDSTVGEAISFSGTGQNWYHNMGSKSAINPKGATCDNGSNYPADGVIPNDQGRGGNCPTSINTVPGYTQYPWEGIQGSYLMAEMLRRQGYKDEKGNDAFQTNDKALMRALEYQWYLQTKFGGVWYDNSRAAWTKHLAYLRYGYRPLVYKASGSGRNMDFTQWTHQK